MNHILVHTRQQECFHKLEMPVYSGKLTREGHLPWSFLIWVWVRTQWSKIVDTSFPEAQWITEFWISPFKCFSSNTCTDFSKGVDTLQTWAAFLGGSRVPGPHTLGGTPLLHGELFWSSSEDGQFPPRNVILLEVIYFCFGKCSTTNIVLNISFFLIDGV
jgi:hypothetical protein